MQKLGRVIIRKWIAATTHPGAMLLSVFILAFGLMLPAWVPMWP
jgi:membrane protein CcdC involved in cytochrome C biogenesis